VERANACDFVSAFAYPLPSTVIFDLLGVPGELHQTIRESSAAAASFSKTVYNQDFDAMESIAERLTAGEKVLQRLIDERRREPKNDLISTSGNDPHRNRGAVTIRQPSLMGLEVAGG
jgi:cytochrome P450